MPERKKPAVRREEIINACRELYETMSFSEISIREIAARTSFSRPSIYNYFLTKEEIFLALLEQEYRTWGRGLGSLFPNGKDPLSAFASSSASLIAERSCLLRLLSMDLNALEENCRMECLVDFKREYGAALQALHDAVQRFCPDFREEEITDFVYAYLPMVQGIYPYAVVSSKQKEAMKIAGIAPQKKGLEDLLATGTLLLLKGTAAR